MKKWIETTDELTRLGIKHNTDKAYYHDFTSFYEKYFKFYKNDHLNILEIGIYEGGSLKMLRDYFPDAKVYGIDIVEESVRRDYGERIETFLCSQDDEDKLNKLFNNMTFDIIIDDGSHMTLHQLKSLGILFKKLRAGGIYVCEDIHTSVQQDRCYSWGDPIDTWKGGSIREHYVTSETLPLAILDDYHKNKELSIPEIKAEDNDYINDHIQQVNVYRRNHSAYKCWNCSTINHKDVGDEPIYRCEMINGRFTKEESSPLTEEERENFELMRGDRCACGTDLSPHSLSCTAVILKK